MHRNVCEVANAVIEAEKFNDVERRPEVKITRMAKACARLKRSSSGASRRAGGTSNKGTSENFRYFKKTFHFHLRHNTKYAEYKRHDSSYSHKTGDILIDPAPSWLHRLIGFSRYILIKSFHNILCRTTIMSRLICDFVRSHPNFFFNWRDIKIEQPSKHIVWRRSAWWNILLVNHYSPPYVNATCIQSLIYTCTVK